MPKTVFEIFLSSTSRDLAPHRTKVREMVERLGQASICMETFGAKPEMPLDACRQSVERADAVVQQPVHCLAAAAEAERWALLRKITVQR